MAMFNRFTERARKVIILAKEEARRFNHDYIGTEHILLGLFMRARVSQRPCFKKWD
jgi:ATP-dependent Clp protease ATP-binding subunit ClpA